jgi:hypothetical protein
VTFRLKDGEYVLDYVSAVTDFAGIARAPLTVRADPGSYTIEAVFSGTNAFEASRSSAEMTAELYDTTTTYAGSKTIFRGLALVVAARVARVGSATPVAGGHVDFDVTAADGRVEHAAASTGADGVARAQIVSEVPLGEYRVRAAFPGAMSDAASVTEESVTVRLLGSEVTYKGATSAYNGDAIDLAARVADEGGGVLAGRDVDFRIIRDDDVVQRVHGRTDMEGEARVTVTLDAGLGDHFVEAEFAGDETHEAALVRAPFETQTHSTALIYKGPGKAVSEDIVDVAALLRRKPGEGIAGEHIVFALVQSGEVRATVEGVTEADGEAHASLPVNVPAGDYRIEASFAGRSAYGESSSGGAFTVTRRETSAGYAGAASALYGEPVVLRANLYRSGGAAISGRGIVFEVENARGVVQTATATTAASGLASAMLPDTVPAGKYRIDVRFAGDEVFAPAKATATLEVAARTTTLAVTTPPAGNRGTHATFSATLTDAAGGLRLAGKPVQFTFGGTEAKALTGDDGRASVDLAVDQAPASYTVHAAFAGDGTHLGSEATSSFEIRH